MKSLARVNYLRQLAPSAPPTPHYVAHFPPDAVATQRALPRLLPPPPLDQSRRASLLVSRIIRALGQRIERAPDTLTPALLDRQAARMMRIAGARPAALHYGQPPQLFPAAICVASGAVLAHGVPDERPLRRGELCTVDVALATTDGVFGDGACAFVVGGTSAANDETLLLLDAAHAVTRAGIDAVRPGAPWSAISAAIEREAKRRGVCVVHECTGHGIGQDFHQQPLIANTSLSVPHAVQLNKHKFMRVGDVFTVEPIVVAASDYDAGILQDDGWTLIEVDQIDSAMIEHTVVVTEDGCEILTTH